MNEKLKRYETLVNLSGVSGHEKYVRAYMKEQISHYTKDIIEDHIGSIMGVAAGDAQGPKIMIAGHMDEVGCVVAGIKDNGFIKVKSIGGIEGNVFMSQHMKIVTEDGHEIRGLFGSTPPHIMRGMDDTLRKIEVDELLLDIGADSKHHAEELGVKIGQMIVPVNNYYETNDGKKIVSKAWDDRFGCGMALDALEYATSGIKHPNIVIAGGTVQEEVGLRGATTVTQMVNPDMFIAVDCSPVGDFLDKDHPRNFGALGKGFLLRFFDPRCIMHQGMKEFIIKTAEKSNIPFQYFLSMGGTDAAAAQLANAGILSATIGMPARYIHSTAAMIHLDDYEAVLAMIKKIIETVDFNVIKEIKENV
jgi:putative aminopeptidase FrvX